ncbi:MAG: DEAD/DEAH box helicase [Deltaproteobacteria bacterium]|nr:DEAD/DEAH box helicase [Deltaproteobacteria bacterium]
MKFSTLDINAKLLQGVDDAGFERCTPIQEQSLPEALAGKDLIAQSQTGTGKTAVFILTIFNKLLADTGEKPKGPRALVMAPTRELAVQLENEAQRLGKHIPLRSVALYGGVEYDKQISALKGGVELVVATPGRMIDLYKSKHFSLNNIEIFIIDEADRMFDMGFAPDIRYIANKLPKDRPRQTMLFSATIDANVRRLAARYMKPDPVFVEIEPEQVTVDKIDQKVLYTSNEEKIPILMALLKRSDMERCIIFTNMKSTAEMVEWKLVANDFPAKVLTGDVSQARRQRIIDNMKSGKVKILVATDVVARGLHIEDISHVINYDLPEEVASYVHRIGRTARAGKSGKAYSLVCEDHAMNLPEIETYIERKIEVEWIEEEELVKDTAGPYRRRRPPQKKGPERGANKGTRAKTRPATAQRKATPPTPEKEKSEKSRSRSKPRREPERTFHFKGKKAGSKPFDLQSVDASKVSTGEKESGAGIDKKATAGGPEKYRSKNPRKERSNPPISAASRPAVSRPARSQDTELPRDEKKKARRQPKSKEERLAFYKKKYGEDFGSKKEEGDSGQDTVEKEERVGFFKRILSVFGRSS